MVIRMFRMFPGSISGRLGLSFPLRRRKPNLPVFRRVRKDSIRRAGFWRILIVSYGNEAA